MNRDLLKKVGRLMVAGFDGTGLNDHARFLLHDLCIGNWIFFARNIAGHDQVIDLCGQLKADTVQCNGRAPFMTIDQEGGIVSRLHGDLNTYPGAMTCAAAGGPELAGEAARITAGHLRSLGFNMNLAPVADINSNPANPVIGPRSFGDDAETVSRYALAAARGYTAGGVVPVYKHFPGHGDTTLDSHRALPVLPHSREVLEKRELLPFRRAIREAVPAIMIAHLVVPALDETGRPASLSEHIIKEFLRETMGFPGLVLTDCLEMQGISNHYSTGDAVKMAFTAGADLLFVSHTPQEQEEGVKSLYDAVQRGEIGESLIDRSLLRQERVLQEYRLKEEAAEGRDSLWRGSCPDPRLQEIHRKAVTVLRNRPHRAEPPLSDLIPFPDGPENLIVHIGRPERFIGENTVSGGDPIDRLRNAWPASRFRSVPADQAEEAFAGEPVHPGRYDRLLIVTADAGFYPGAVGKIQELTQGTASAAVAVMRTPYEAACYPEADALILCYENTVEGVESLIALLKGEISGEGRCPVGLPGFIT